MIGERQARSRFLLWAVGEIAIVALGILIAFGLNAWWVARGERAEEQTHLRALAVDFERNVGLYDELSKNQEGIVQASLELLKLARQNPDADAATVSKLVNRVFSSHRQRPALDAYEALVSSAGLTVIRDEKLRADLAGFADRASDPYQERYSDQIYMAFTTRFIGRLQIAGAISQVSPEPQSYGELLRDSAFQEHLALRHVIEGDVAAGFRQRLKEAQSILEQLRAQIGN
jgi:hypothetical protein